MYKASVPLEELSNEIGRARAFTAGWYERETIFLYMEYNDVRRINIDGDEIGEPFSKNVRNGEVNSIEVYYI